MILVKRFEEKDKVARPSGRLRFHEGNGNPDPGRKS